MRLLICLSFLLSACSSSSEDAQPTSLLQVTGRIENSKLDEASGLARSNRAADLYWAVNDDGPAAIHAFDAQGRNHGVVQISGARNRDWEDIASFELDETAYLLIADIGDNGSKHKHLSLYVVAEPTPEQDTVTIAWQVDFVYPGGPRDAEALAVDAEEQQIYVLSKRTVPAELYRVPLKPAADDVVAATPVMVVDSLPQPSQRDLQNAAGSGWAWQPTAMDFAPDGRSAIILTYDGINYFAREADQSWAEALAGIALHLSLGRIENAESITYTDDGQAAILTVEKKHAPVFRAELVLEKSNN